MTMQTTEGRAGASRGGSIKHAPQLQTFRPPQSVSDLAWKNAHLCHREPIEPQLREENLYIGPTVMPLVWKLIRREPLTTEQLKVVRDLIRESDKNEPAVNPVVYDLLAGAETLRWADECLSKKAAPAGATVIQA